MWLAQFPRLYVEGTWGQSAAGAIIVKSNKVSLQIIRLKCPGADGSVLPLFFTFLLQQNKVNIP